MQELRIAKTSGKKNSVGVPTLPNFKKYCKATVKAELAYKQTNISLKYKRQSRSKPTYILITDFDKAMKSNTVEKTVAFFTNNA